MIFFNWIGFAIVLAGVIMGAAADALIGGSSMKIAAGLGMGVMDLIYRSNHKEPGGNTAFFHPKRGGNLMFIPVWIIGAVILVVGLSR